MPCDGPVPAGKGKGRSGDTSCRFAVTRKCDARQSTRTSEKQLRPLAYLPAGGRSHRSVPESSPRWCVYNVGHVNNAGKYTKGADNRLLQLQGICVLSGTGARQRPTTHTKRFPFLRCDFRRWWRALPLSSLRPMEGLGESGIPSLPGMRGLGGFPRGPTLF
jgi:hypothetical protein